MVLSQRATTAGFALTPGGWPGKRKKEPLHMEVEQWPVVQAFGLSDLHTGGFFTMKHAVHDVTPALHALWAHVDAQTLQSVLCASLAALHHHWRQFVQVFDGRSVARRCNVSELQAVDPLYSWYEFGRIRFKEAVPASRTPKVRFGSRTNLTVAATLEDDDDASLIEAVCTSFGCCDGCR